MTRGLVRNNNLSDLPSVEQARINLGLATVDLNRIRGLFSSAGVLPSDVQRIAGSTANYQQQVNSINTTISGIVPALYVEKTGDFISGAWTNTGVMSAVSVLISGSTPQASSDALFVHDYQAGQFELTTATMTAASGLTVETVVDRGGVVFASGVVTNKLVPLKIGGVQFFLEAG
jgi:hypothetical protein